MERPSRSGSGVVQREMKVRTEMVAVLNTLRTGDADLRFYITTVQDG
jgi:hypothetical protein